MEESEEYQYGRDFTCHKCTLKDIEDDIFTNLKEEFCKDCEDYISKDKSKSSISLIEW
jgi:hypothetical protein